jgi:hypothetical protein
VQEVADKVRAGQQLNRYGYGERPLREEITQGVTNDAGRRRAIPGEARILRFNIGYGNVATRKSVENIPYAN